MNFLKELCNKEKKKKINQQYEINNEKYISYKLNKSNNNYECVICLDYMKNNQTVILTECFHMYHKECIIEWFKINNICPTCDFVL